MRSLFPPLLSENRVFRRFWTGQTISLMGDQVTLIALPLSAVLVLDANAAQMGYLVAAELTPNLLFALHAGAWVDRRGGREGFGATPPAEATPEPVLEEDSSGFGEMAGAVPGGGGSFLDESSRAGTFGGATIISPRAVLPGGDADGTDGGDADGTDGDSTDTTDGDAGDADGTDA